MPLAATATFAAALGAAIGSFFNVVAYRLPKGQSLLHPGSCCPACGDVIKPYDNVPVLGWLLLRGRCRSCTAAISPRYPLVEASCATLAVAVVLTQPSPVKVALGLTLVAALVPIVLIDLDHGLIPNLLTLSGAIAAIVFGLALRPAGVPEQLIAGGGAAGFLLCFVLAYPRGMGMGDVKLAGLLGLCLGRSVLVAIFLGVLAGTVFGAGVMARLGVARGRKTKVPFGPFLAFGAVVALFAGGPILHWYLHAGL